MEGEAPGTITPPTFQPPVNDGPAEILSGGKWINLTIDPGKINETIPETGIILDYPAVVATTADYDIWAHIGYELVRASFDWRIDQGDWHTSTSADNTVDVQELGVWAPVAWLNLGKQNLTAGKHTLEIRLKRPTADAKAGNFLFGLDAICLASKPFHPDGSIKPGDNSWMTDADKAAQSQTFIVPKPVDTTQASLSLAGQWQYEGDDELVVDDRLGPVKSIPSADSLNWHAINVPGDRNTALPHEEYVHRYYLRTRVNVPADLAGHSFVLHVPAENMIATVFVNGQSCGFTKDNYAAWDCDITKAIKPGQVNEIWVAIKDSFYGLADDADVKHPQYTPFSFWPHKTTTLLDMPVLGKLDTGFVTTEPMLVVGGGVYTSDVFAIPSVKNKTLGLEVTVHNSTSADASVQVGNAIEPLAGGAAEKTFAPQTVTVPAGKDMVVKLSEPWANPKLWWQNDPQQYNAVTQLTVGGKVVDERKTKFGFREWTWDGPEFKLNGIPFHGFADIDTTDIAKLRTAGQDMVRVWGENAKTQAYIDECDAKGMPVRRTDIFDGEGAAGFYNLVDNSALWDNYREQLLAWAKGQRNHPSIFIWSMENEISFINGHVSGHDKITTGEMKKAADLLMPLDPTRPVMTDGGNANLDESLPVYGGHYMEPPLNKFPESIYDRDGYSHRQVWPITQTKPILFGEAAYVSGTSQAEHATVGGEAAFLGQAEARPAKALELLMLSEGYRWLGISFHFWAKGEIPTYHKAWQPVAVLSRQWDWTFGSGEKVVRTLGIFNDSRAADPITLNWNLTLNGTKAGEGSSVHNIAPGMNEKFDVTLPMPTVTARQEGVLTLTLTQGGKTVFEDTKDVSVLPPPTAPDLAKAAPGSIALFDPNNSVKDFLAGAKVPFTTFDDLTKIPATAKVVIIGKDALTTATATSSQLAAWVSQGDGRVVIALEQTHPLSFQGLPGQMTPDTNAGCLGFPEDTTSPILTGLRDKDFLTWGQDGYLYRNAYAKPTSGGKSIVQCDTKLADSALVQMQAGSGIMLLSQLLIGEKIKTNPVAQQLLLNLVDYANKYKLKQVDTYAVIDDNPPLLKAVDATGLKYTKASDPLAAIATPGTIAIVNASAANLKTLASNLPKVKAFTGGGGWLFLNNLTPDGLADFNILVGVNHQIRPFGREKISWPATRNPLTAGMSPGDVVLGTGKAIVTYHAGDWPDPEAYSYVVDYDDAAPFASSTYSAWGNAIGGFTMYDGAWQLIQNMPAENAVVPIKLARPEKILQFVWTSDLNYAGTTKIQVTINGKDYTFDTQPNGDTQTFDIPDQPTASDLTFKIIDWTHDAKKQNDKETVGIDNIKIKVARPADFFDKVKPILNVGAIVEYPQGKGGIILCNVKYKGSETNPANVTKKQAILAGLLRNVGAAFTGGKTKTIIAGGNLDFTPVDISKQANQFRGDQGWFGDKAHTFEALPAGKQAMAGVNYDIYHFTTSVVPEAIMLGGKGVPGNLPDNVLGIPVNRKADALFFLQAASIYQKRNAKEVQANKRYEMADYYIHYADGKEEKVPIYSEINVENYKQTGDPIAIPGAQIAWSSPYTEPNTNAVAYSMQWTNPRPDDEISSIDFVYGPDRVGVPALLAITAADSKATK
jgi:beta-galactosidase